MIHKPSDLSSVLSHINEETNEDTLNILNKRRKDNSDGLMFGNLNINSINTKFDQMKFLMQRKVDILVLTETKLDNSLLVCNREDLHCKELRSHSFAEDN